MCLCIYLRVHGYLIKHIFYYSYREKRGCSLLEDDINSTSSRHYSDFTGQTLDFPHVCTQYSLSFLAAVTVSYIFSANCAEAAFELHSCVWHHLMLLLKLENETNRKTSFKGSMWSGLPNDYPPAAVSWWVGSEEKQRCNGWIASISKILVMGMLAGRRGLMRNLMGLCRECPFEDPGSGVFHFLI